MGARACRLSASIAERKSSPYSERLAKNKVQCIRKNACKYVTYLSKLNVTKEERMRFPNAKFTERGEAECCNHLWELHYFSIQ